LRRQQACEEIVSDLIREIGFNPIDLGNLNAARYMEPFCLLVAQMAYSRAGGAELAYRFERVPAQAH